MAATDATLMMEPPPARIMCGMAYFITKKGAVRLVSTTRCQSSSSISTTFAMMPVPALLTTMSNLPPKATVVSTMRCASPGLPASAAQTVIWLAEMFFATLSSISRRRPVMQTLAPSRTNASATAAPMPVPPPVIIATLPCNLMRLSYYYRASATGLRVFIQFGEPQAHVTMGTVQHPIKEYRNEMGLFVKRGEKGIQILAPIVGYRRNRKDAATEPEPECDHPGSQVASA